MDQILTTCGLCSCGCAMYVRQEGGRISGVSPSAHHPVSTARLCIKGWNALPALLAEERLRTPLIRKGKHLEPTSWKEAIAYTASSLKQCHPKEIGVIGSGKLTNEECYSVAKLARGIIKTPNVDSGSRFADASATGALLATIGTSSSQVDLNTIAHAGSMLIVGANVMEQLPHIGSRILDAIENGCQIVVLDPRDSKLAPLASTYIHPEPGTDLLWMRALLRAILDQKLCTDSSTELLGFEELRNSLESIGPGQLAVDTEAIKEAAETIAHNPPLVVMFGLGVMQQANSSEIVKALANIATLLGGSIVPLRGQANAQGASEMGMAHDFLPGYGMLSDPTSRKFWGIVWDCELADEVGMSAVDMIQSGDLKTMMVFGENVALSAPNSKATSAALEKLDFLAVADLYMTETAKLADIVFPACSFLEKDGTFTNIERRAQCVRKVLEPIGESRSDLDIMADIAAELGTNMQRDPKKVLNEIATGVTLYKGISYEKASESWGHQVPLNGAIPRLTPVSAVDVPGQDDAYPLKLVSSRAIFPQHTGSVACRSSVLAREYPETYAELSEADAEKLGLRAGALIKISSKSGTLTRRLLLSDSVKRGCIHVPHYFGGDSPNALASYECDPESGVPIYKGLSVKVEAVK